MSHFLIVYAGPVVVRGRTAEDWRTAPDDGVQVVARFQRAGPLRWTCDGVPVRDRELWTGEDVYNLNGWGEKRGTLLTDEEYQACYRRAALGDD